MTREFDVEADFIHNDFRCVVLMNDFGTRCGYVGITKDHFLYAVKHSDRHEWLKRFKDGVMEQPIGKRGMIDVFCEALADDDSISAGSLFNIHGGITYSNGGVDSKYPVKSDLWWFGFDCAHAGDGGDLSKIKDPRTRASFSRCTFPGDVIRTKEYVIEECKNLSDQLLAFDLVDISTVRKE